MLVSRFLFLVFATGCPWQFPMLWLVQVTHITVLVLLYPCKIQCKFSVQVPFHHNDGFLGGLFLSILIFEDFVRASRCA